MQACGNPAISLASPIAAERASPSGTTRLASPKESASAAWTGRPRQDHVERAGLPDQPGQTDRSAVDQRHSPAPLEDAEHRRLGDNPQIAHDGKFEPARDAIALDRRDDRLGEVPAGRAERAVVDHPVPVELSSRRGLEVGACAECAARARQHDGADRVIGLRLPETVAEPFRLRRIDGVARFGPVHGEDAHGAVGLGMQHGGLLVERSQSLA